MTAARSRHRPLAIAAILLAIAFNVPYTILSIMFDYPGILRRPAEQVLRAFADGGPTLVLTWYAFTLTAFALVPFAISLAFADEDWRSHPVTAVGAAVAGALAGLAQAIGLSRWVFAVPALARHAGEPASGAVHDVLNGWGGVAIGEHLGQMLTCLWIGYTVAGQLRAPGRLSRAAAVAGTIAALSIAFGLGEGIAIALDAPGDLFSLGTIAGYLALSIWLVLTGAGLLVNGRRR